MIGFLKGELHSTQLNEALLMVQGVGYELQVTLSTADFLRDQQGLGQAAEVFVHTHVREDALSLFGFRSQLEKEVFLSLLKVNGIGPKSALNILSATSVDQLLNLIEEGNAKALSQLPKVGKKTAEQMILSLKGKLTFVDEFGGDGAPGQSKKEITSALMHLGFKVSDIDKVVSKQSAQMTLEEGVRQALQELTQ